MKLWVAMIALVGLACGGTNAAPVPVTQPRPTVVPTGPTYPIVIDRAVAVGEQYLVQTVVTTQSTAAGYGNGRRVHQSSESKATTLKARFTIVEINAAGQATRLTLDVTEFSVHDGMALRNLVPNGTRLFVMGAATTVMMNSPTIPAPDIVKEPLAEMFEHGILFTDDNTLLGTTPQPVGATWPARNVVDSFQRELQVAVQARGHCKLERIVQLDGVDCMELTSEIVVLPSALRGLELPLESGQLTIRSQMLIPLDLSLPRYEQTSEFMFTAVAAGMREGVQTRVETTTRTVSQSTARKVAR